MKFNGDWKHIAIGCGVVAAGAAFHFLAGQDWATLVGPSGALIVGGVLTIGNEYLTNLAPKT